MSLSTQLTPQVFADIREKGKQYFLRGAVRCGSVEPYSASATVTGTQVYDVDLYLQSRSVMAACTCPYVEENVDICKHIWATILAAESRGFASHAVGKGHLTLLLDDVYDYEDEYEEEEYDRGSYRRTYTPPPKPHAKSQTKALDWQSQLKAVSQQLASETNTGTHYRQIPVDRQLLYIISGPESIRTQQLVLELQVQERKMNGEWGKPKSFSLQSAAAERFVDSWDRQMIALLQGPTRHSSYSYGYYQSSGDSSFRLSNVVRDSILPVLAQTNRVYLRQKNSTPPELDHVTADLDPAWAFRLEISPSDTGKQWWLTGQLQRGEETMTLFAPTLLLPGLIFWNGRFGRLDDSGAFGWISQLRQAARIAVPATKGAEFLEQLLQMPKLPPLKLPEPLQYSEESVAPRPKVVIKQPKIKSYRPMLDIELSFEYDGIAVPASLPSRGVFQTERKRFLLRDAVAEKAAEQELIRHGARRPNTYGENQPQIQPSQLPKFVRELVGAGWKVEADGKLYRTASSFELHVDTEHDWFDLHGAANFDGQTVPFPRLLEALRRGDSTVNLGDGTFGMLPEEWLKKYGLFAQMGTVEGDSVRFSRAQVGILDALLASRPEVSFDEQFGKARQELRKFDGIKAQKPPKTFTGELREYQSEGLGWLQFLRKFGFGGCLADDMGLGKTVQVLSLLSGKLNGPVLVVVPRSLIFNWKQEAAKFAPKLKVLDHTGTNRERGTAHFKDYNLILTTYGTLRNDAELFADFRFDTCVLDESQAAKNPNSETAKAVRIVQADHRLALSGTPVENHLGELWTLFDFLNPGMLGRSTFLAGGVGTMRNPDEESRQILAKALKPFILRRTKTEVAKDLPAKSEQTVYCDLEPAQRQLYDELREHYRQSLLSRVEEFGLKKSKIHVLEALLRLRQAACHPGLIDTKRKAETSAKLEVLMPQLSELAEGGSKVLVFSQFTTFLDIVRTKLNADKIPYEYLDGRTRDRAARVERFQTDPDCRLFLVSLKAGGVGLNLTAAEYVFILDPWWNPAVEAQAIDRTHRIGQTKPVFAYRLIARGTVEEKVLALQASKRALADAILGGDGSLITDLKREDLEMLLS